MGESGIASGEAAPIILEFSFLYPIFLESALIIIHVHWNVNAHSVELFQEVWIFCFTFPFGCGMVKKMMEVSTYARFFW